MLLGDLVSGRPHVCGPETTLHEASVAMSEAGHGSLGVVEGRVLLGIITERDLVRALAQGVDPGSEPVRSWMGTEPDVFPPTAEVFEAAEWLLASGYRHLPVVDETGLLGIVSLRNLLRGVLDALEEE
jgi:CBS domain-containing protein